MSVLTRVALDQIDKALSRWSGGDLATEVARTRALCPRELASAHVLQERLAFLQELAPDPVKAERFYERVLNGNELQDVNYLARGALAARSVARIELREPSGRRLGWGTGFLIAPRVLLTNHHVLPGAEHAFRSNVQFGYERDIEGRPKEPAIFDLLPNDLYFTDAELDFTVVGVALRDRDNQRALEEWGHLPLVRMTGKVAEGEWMTIVQHPSGDYKQVCVRENHLMRRTADVLWYSSDTLGGSSGSPVFSNDWLVVALHHSGVPVTKDGRIQTIDGRDFDPDQDGEERIRWIANEGIRVSRIVQTLNEKRPSHPLLASVSANHAEASTASKSLVLPQITLSPERTLKGSPMTEHQTWREVQVRLRVSDSGEVTVASSQATAFESAPDASASRLQERKAAFDAPFDEDYASRKGYDESFLGSQCLVHLPEAQPSLKNSLARLLEDDKTYVLKYHNYSLAMHAQRRLAVYSAANLDAGGRWELARPTDRWRTDPRIDLKHQLGAFYYEKNRFDRGHLTRREDLEYGTTVIQALTSAADTCHFTNCAPQHEKFNQNRSLWQGIERYLLEESVELSQIRANVITGPVLEESDRRYKGIQYPARYWKVVAALNSERDLFATAYILDQSEVIEQYGIERAGEAPFGAFKTYQTTVAAIEELTQLKFSATLGSRKTPLSTCDPLQTKQPRSSRRRVSTHEAAWSSGRDTLLLEDLEQIVKG